MAASPPLSPTPVWGQSSLQAWRNLKLETIQLTLMTLISGRYMIHLVTPTMIETSCWRAEKDHASNGQAYLLMKEQEVCKQRFCPADGDL